MFSNTKPDKIFIFKFRNGDIVDPYRSDSRYSTFHDKDYILTELINENYFKDNGYYELFDIGKDYVVKRFLKKNVYLMEHIIWVFQ